MSWGEDAALQEDLNLLGCPYPHPRSVPELMEITVVGNITGVTHGEDTAPLHLLFLLLLPLQATVIWFNFVRKIENLYLIYSNRAPEAHRGGEGGHKIIHDGMSISSTFHPPGALPTHSCEGTQLLSSASSTVL